MNTLIIAEAVPIIKDDATAQLRISSVLPRKDGRWNVLYAVGFKKNTIYTILYGKKWRKKAKKLLIIFATRFCGEKILREDAENTEISKTVFLDSNYHL